MKYIFSVWFCSLMLFSAEIVNIMEKTSGGFVVKPSEPRECSPKLVETVSTGFIYTGKITWGADSAVAEGEPYADGMVFVSEGKTRAWEFVGKTNKDGTFALPIIPYTQFKLYAWDGSGNIMAKYDGHFYYNSELDNLYMTPTGGKPYIAEKGDVIVEKI